MDFSKALDEVKCGNRVARSGWNGKDMWIAYSPGCEALKAENFWSYQGKKYAEEQGGSVEVLPLLIMKTADGKILMGWLASQADMLAEDWEIVQ